MVKKSRTMPKNPKRGHLGSLNVFYKPKTSKKCKLYPLIKFENYRKKSHSAEKKPKGGPFGLTCTFGSIKNLWFSARIEPTLSGFRKLVEVEQIVKSGPLRVRLSTEKELLTVIVGLFFLKQLFLKYCLNQLRRYTPIT